jgi:hypothetical protein
MSKQEINQNLDQNTQQLEDNVSSIVENDGELSMEELDSVAGGGTIFTMGPDKPYKVRWQPW